MQEFFIILEIAYHLIKAKRRENGCGIGKLNPVGLPEGVRGYVEGEVCR